MIELELELGGVAHDIRRNKKCPTQKHHPPRHCIRHNFGPTPRNCGGEFSDVPREPGRHVHSDAHTLAGALLHGIIQWGSYDSHGQKLSCQQICARSSVLYLKEAETMNSNDQN